MSHIGRLAHQVALNDYFECARRAPLLSPEREQQLFKALKKNNDLHALAELTHSHLRLVIKHAVACSKYFPAPLDELISAGNIGLLKAIKKFNPSHGHRLGSFAIPLIKAEIKEYSRDTRSIVKIVTTPGRKKVFYNLSGAKAKLGILEVYLSPENALEISTLLGVTTQEVLSVSRHLAGDSSLNAPVSNHGNREKQDGLISDGPDPEMLYSEKEDNQQKRMRLAAALASLNNREREILIARRLSEPKKTFDSLAAQYNLSRQRVRVIEMNAYEKIRKAMRDDDKGNVSNSSQWRDNAVQVVNRIHPFPIRNVINREPARIDCAA